MKPQHRGALLAGTLAVALSAPTISFATGTCYVVGGGNPTIALRYIATSKGALTSDAEIKNFNHLRQTLYEVDGKSTLLLQLQKEPCAAGATCTLEQAEYESVRVMATVTGSAITGAAATKYPADEPGAHLGFTLNIVRDIEYSENTVFGPIHVECTSPYVSPRPSRWICNARIDFTLGVVFALPTPFELYRVNAAENEACSIFQDGENFPSLPPVLDPDL
jgi:hypothetical protein